MAAATAAVSKQKQGNAALTGGKIRLNSSASNSSSSTSGSKSQASGANKASGVTSASSSKHTNGANNTHNSSGSSDNSNISSNGNGDNAKVNSKLNSKNGCGSGGSGSGNGGKDSDKHRGDKNRGGGASASSNKVQEPPLKKQKVRNYFFIYMILYKAIKPIKYVITRYSLLDIKIQEGICKKIERHFTRSIFNWKRYTLRYTSKHSCFYNPKH